MVTLPLDCDVVVVRVGAPGGIGICKAWMPAHAISIGISVNVPLCFSLTALQLLKKPLYHFSTDIKCRQPPPMTVIGLPYSLLVQVDVSLAMVAPVHFIVDACMRPKLWPS